MSLIVTGAAGFIGSNFVLDWLAQFDETVINLDDLTYAGNLENLAQPMLKNPYGQYLISVLQEKVF